MRAGKAKQEMDTTRYRLDPPPLNRRNDISAWRAAVDNAHSQLEHQYNRRVLTWYLQLLTRLLKKQEHEWTWRGASCVQVSRRISLTKTWVVLVRFGCGLLLKVVYC